MREVCQHSDVFLCVLLLSTNISLTSGYPLKFPFFPLVYVFFVFVFFVFFFKILRFFSQGQNIFWVSNPQDLNVSDLIILLVLVLLLIARFVVGPIIQQGQSSPLFFAPGWSCRWTGQNI